MNKEQLKKLSREEKINIYIKTEDEIQKIWGNPAFLGRDGFFNDISNKQIENHIIDNYGQLKFEKTIIYGKRFFYFVVGTFILLGIIGLLFFGIKQLFGI